MTKKIEIQTGPFTFDGYQTGDPNHTLVLWLHGFPEGAYMWIRLMKGSKNRSGSSRSFTWNREIFEYLSS